MKALKPISALSIGHVTHDRYDDEIVPGGCAFYAASTWKSLGANVGLVTALGEDFACEDELSGMEVFRSIGPRTTVFTNTYPQDGPRIQWVESTAPEVKPDTLPYKWRKADVVFMAPVFGEMDLAKWSGVVQADLIGLGLQGFLKQAGSPHPDGAGRRAVVARPFDLELDLLKRLNAVFLSEEDIQVFGDDNLLSKLRESVPLVVVTRGDQGSRLYLKRETIEVGISNIPKGKAIDSTGAGDTYAAAFLFALAQDASPVKAAKLAAAAASIVIEGRGGECLHRVGEALESNYTNLWR